jgi:hypothetical protein
MATSNSRQIYAVLAAYERKANGSEHWNQYEKHKLQERNNSKLLRHPMGGAPMSLFGII